MHAHTHPQKQTGKLVKLARQAEYTLPVGMIKSKLGYTVISLTYVVLSRSQKFIFDLQLIKTGLCSFRFDITIKSLTRLFRN